jgi:hypothetical protein
MEMTPQELEEYKQYLASQGFEPNEADEYLTEQGVKIKEPPGLVRQALGGAAAGLDYLGGVARTGVADIADTIQGNSKVTGEDWKAALNPMDGKLAPGSAEYMDRMGVPEGAKANLFPEVRIPFTDVKLGEGDTSVRDAVGFVGDAALDPLTYATFGASTLAKEGAKQVAKGGLREVLGRGMQGVAKGATVVGDTAKSLGKKMYKSGFKKVDERLIEKNVKPLSDVMWERGKLTGGAESLQEQADTLAKFLENERKGLYDQADGLGATVDMEKASQKALTEAQRLKGIRGAEDVGESLESYIKGYYEPKGGPQSFNPLTLRDEAARLPPLSISEASNVKTRFWDSLPDAAFNKAGKLKGDAKKINKAMGGGTADEIVNSANQVKPGLGNQIDEINQDWGSIISAQKPLQSEVRKANTKNAFSSVDGAGAGMTFANPGVGAAMLTGKKLGDLSKGTWFRTKGGKLLNQAGETNLLDPLTRQVLINELGPQSPWVDVQKKK